MQPRKHPLKNAVIIFFLGFFIWALLQFFAPLTLPPGSVSNLGGVVGICDNDYTTQDMSFPWNMMYSIGDRLCHQIPERSFFLNGNQMPFCARCTTIWVGLAVGLGFMVLYTFELNWKLLIAFILLLAPLGVDGSGQLFGLWESTNILRILTGLPAGIICGVAIGIIIDELGTMSFFRRIHLT
ncbi:hypothetical protein AYK25_08035 [Thermoplasmatales archaeon SM1-50]|nr:MAG: hypothetical protein AYK25_08035 [Thermoplasmatales archaeon SM1-50]